MNKEGFRPPHPNPLCVQSASNYQPAPVVLSIQSEAFLACGCYFHAMSFVQDIEPILQSFLFFW